MVRLNVNDFDIFYRIKKLPHAAYLSENKRRVNVYDVNVVLSACLNTLRERQRVVFRQYLENNKHDR